MRAWILSAALLVIALNIEEITCQCTRGGRKFNKDAEWLKGDCRKRFKCKSNGEIKDYDYSCPNNAVCRNGQCQCDSGFQLKSRDSRGWLKKCERGQTNQCKHGNRNYNKDDEWLKGDCSKKYKCKDKGEVKEYSYNCPSNARCQNGQCQCESGFQVKSRDSKGRAKKCERAQSNQCKQGNKNYNKDDEWLKGDCSKKYKCKDKGEVKEYSYNCPSNARCQNGQCQCESGFQVKSRDSKGRTKKCERAQSNQCKQGNKNYNKDDEWLKGDCSKKYKCKDKGEVKEYSYNCPSNARCQNGQCQCESGFQVKSRDSKGRTKKCERAQSNQCKQGNKNYNKDDEWLKGDCSKKYKCKDKGEVKEYSYNCPSNARCQNGQCQCESGFQVKSRDSKGRTKKCERSSNKCEYNGKKYNDGSEWLKSDCSRKFKCNNGQLKENGHSCPNNAFCNGEGRCRCQQSYEAKERSSKGLLKSCSLKANSGSCQHNNRQFGNGKAWLRNDCAQKFICENGNIKTRSHNCPSKSTCDNGQCKCQNNYKEKSRDSKGLLKRCEEKRECEYNLKSFNNGDSWLNAKCDRKMTCRNRNVQSRSYRCPTHSSCKATGQCVCDFGYESKSADNNGFLKRCKEKDSMKCSSGFQRIFNKCLSITKNSRLTFSQAHDKCKKKGGRMLVSEDSFELFEQLKKDRRYKDGHYFIMGDRSVSRQNMNEFKPAAKRFVLNMMERYKCDNGIRYKAFKRFGGKPKREDWNFNSPLSSRCMAIDENGPNLFRCSERKGYICEQVSNENEEENVYMTKWYSASKPSNKGEKESLKTILEKYNNDYKDETDRICQKPIGMECRIVGTNKLLSKDNPQGLKLKYACVKGKVECRTSDQAGGTSCPNIEVRFKCVNDDSNDCGMNLVKKACDNQGKTCVNRRTGAVCIKQKKKRDKSDKINTGTCFMNGEKHVLYRCKATGDPHYETFDGFKYDFMGICSYDFVSTCNGYAPTVTYPSFKISSKNYKHKASSRATWTNGFMLGLGDVSYVFTQGKMFVDDIEVNSVEFEDDQIKINAKASGKGTTLVIETKFCLQIQWDNLHGLSVFVPEHYKKHLCGLCGNFDGNARNDLTVEGTNQKLSSDVINREYMVASFMKASQPTVCPMKVIEPEPCSAEDIRRISQPNQCGVFDVDGDSPLVKAVRENSDDSSRAVNLAGLKEEFKECVNDVCWDATTNRCHDIGKVINGIHQALGIVDADLDAAWRRYADCENSAETRCGDKPNMKFYRSLRTGCQNTCKDPEKAAKCDDENEEAGCGCEEGFVFDARMNCVAPEECENSCDVELEDGQRFSLNDGDEYVKTPCKKIVVCNKGTLEEKILTACSIHASCVDEGRKCVCHEGFVGNGNECVSDLSCKRGYTAVGEKCYKFVEQKMDWHSAAITCGQDGSVLARYDDLVGEELSSFFESIPKQYINSRGHSRQVYCRRDAQCKLPRGYIGLGIKLRQKKDEQKCAGKFALANDKKSVTVSGECQAKFYVKMIKESRIKQTAAFRVWVAGNLYVVAQGQRGDKPKFQIDPPEMLDLNAFGNPQGCFMANLNGDGKLIVSPIAKCDHQKPFICEYDNVGKIPHNPNDFKRLNEKGNFQEAIEMCGKLNRPLAGIYNSGQNSKIRDMLRQLGGDGWVGGSFNEGFKWSDGNRFKYINWVDREPNNFRNNPGSNEMCVAMSKGSGRWYTEDCNEPLYPICGPPLNMEPATYSKYYKVKGFTSLPELRQKLAREGKPDYVCKKPIAIECSAKQVSDGGWRNNFNQKNRAMECTAEKLQCKKGQGIDCSFFRVRVLCPSDENQCETLKKENINPCTGGRTCIPVRNHYICRCTGENEWDHQKQSCHQSCGHCMASGDPHYTTFNGDRYDFMGTCMYKFAGVCDLDEFKTGPNFDIYTKNKLCGDRGASCIFYVEVHLRNIKYMQNGNERTGNFIFKISRDRGNIYYLNDREHGIGELSIPGAFKVVRKQNYFNMISEALSLDVLFSGTKLSLNLPDQFIDKMCGLCGDCGTDKFKKRDGTLVSVPKNGQKLDRTKIIPVATEWTVPFDGSDPEICKVVEPIAECTAEMSERVKGPNMCGVFKDPDSVISDCFDQIDVEPYYSDCVVDACHENPMVAVCGTVRTYAQACMKRKGVIMDWRSTGFCPMNCKEKMYRADASCEPMCGRDDSTSAICDEDPEEGCVCPAGFMRQGDECVTPDRCGCKIAIGDSQTVTIKIGESRVLPRCEEIATCEERENGDSQEMRESITMDPYAICVEDPLPRIDCLRGYILQEDGRTCKRDPEACSEGYDEKSGMCISVPKIKKVWRQAAYACNEKDGTLALINSEAKWAEIENIMKEEEYEQIFISGQVKVTIVDGAPVYEPVLESTQRGKIEYYNFDYHSPPVMDIQLSEDLDMEQLRGQETILALVARMGASGSAAIVAVPRDTQANFVCEERYVKPKEEEWYGPCNSDSNMADNGDQETRSSLKKMECLVCPHPMDVGCIKNPRSTGTVAGECKVTKSGTYYSCTQGVDCIDYAVETKCARDVDECEKGLHDCPERSTCHNTIGAYTCKCDDEVPLMIKGYCHEAKTCSIFGPRRSNDYVYAMTGFPSSQGYAQYRCPFKIFETCEDKFDAASGMPMLSVHVYTRQVDGGFFQVFGGWIASPGKDGYKVKHFFVYDNLLREGKFMYGDTTKTMDKHDLGFGCLSTRTNFMFVPPNTMVVQHFDKVFKFGLTFPVNFGIMVSKEYAQMACGMCTYESVEREGIIELTETDEQYLSGSLMGDTSKCSIDVKPEPTTMPPPTTQRATMPPPPPTTTMPPPPPTTMPPPPPPSTTPSLPDETGLFGSSTMAAPDTTEPQPPPTTMPPPPPPTTTMPPPPPTTMPAPPPPSTTPSLPDETGLFGSSTMAAPDTTEPQPPPTTMPPPTTEPPPPRPTTTMPPPPPTTMPPPPSTTPQIPDETTMPPPPPTTTGPPTAPPTTTMPPPPPTTMPPPPSTTPQLPDETTMPPPPPTTTGPPTAPPTTTMPPPPPTTMPPPPSTTPQLPDETTMPPPPPTTTMPPTAPPTTEWTTPPSASPTPVVDYFCEEDVAAFCFAISDLCSIDYGRCHEDLCFTDRNLCTYLETTDVGECQIGFEMDAAVAALKDQCDEYCAGEDMSFYFTGGDAPERCQDTIPDDGETTSGMGSFACGCDDGYKLSGGQCVPQEECGCNYNGGFYLKKDDVFVNNLCTKKAICLGNGEIEESPMECSLHASCLHTQDGPACVCDQGFFGDADMPNGCKEPDDEDDSKVCYTKTTTYGVPVTTCNCKMGYVSNCTHCVDLDECTENLHDCDLSIEMCQNIPGSFECSCALGFEAVEGECKDINECQRGLARCGSNSGCVNTPGSYECACCAGFMYSADAGDCVRDPDSVEILVASPKCCLQCDYPDLCDSGADGSEPYCVIGAGLNKQYDSYKALFQYYCVNNLPLPRNRVRDGECPEVDPTSSPTDPNNPDGGSQTTAPGGEGPTIPGGGEGGNPTSNPEGGETTAGSNAQTPPPPESCDDSEFCQKIPPPPPSLSTGPVCGPSNQVNKETFPSYCEMVKSICKKNGGPDSVPNDPVAAEAGECPEPTTTTPTPPPSTESPPPPVSMNPITEGNNPNPITAAPAPSETTERAEPTTSLPPSEPLLTQWTPWGRCRVQNRDLSCGLGRQSRTRSVVPFDDDREVLPVTEDQTYEERSCFEPCDPEDPDVPPEECPDPGVCGEDENMVCGSIGPGGPETYMSECELNIEACKAGEKPNIISRGECGEEQEPRQMCNSDGRNIWTKHFSESEGMTCVSEEVNINTCAHLGCEGGFENCCIPSDYKKVYASMDCMDADGNSIRGTKVFLSAIDCRCSNGEDDEAGTPIS